MGQENQPEVDRAQGENKKEGMRTSTKWAIAVTVVWLGGVAIYVFCNWCAFLKMEPNAIGDFLAGTMSPLALFWLVAGYRQQGEELRLNTETLKLQHTELIEQVKATQQVAVHSERQAQAAQFMADSQREAQQRRIDEDIRLATPEFQLTAIKLTDESIGAQVFNTGGTALDVSFTNSKGQKINLSSNNIMCQESAILRLDGVNLEEDTISVGYREFYSSMGTSFGYTIFVKDGKFSKK